MISSYGNVLQLAAGAPNAFAPASTSLDPLPVEAVEAYRRAKRYRDNSMMIGLAVGGALGLSFLLVRRPVGW